MTKKVFISFFSNFFAGSLLSLPLCNTENIITREQNKQLRSSFLLCLILSILLSLKKFLYCQFVLHIKHILSHVTPGMPPRKTDGFSWYVVRATRPERVNVKFMLGTGGMVATLTFQRMVATSSILHSRPSKSTCVGLHVIIVQIYYFLNK